MTDSYIRYCEACFLSAIAEELVIAKLVFFPSLRANEMSEAIYKEWIAAACKQASQ